MLTKSNKYLKNNNNKQGQSSNTSTSTLEPLCHIKLLLSLLIKKWENNII